MINYKDKYHNHFDNSLKVLPHNLLRDKNFLVRFNTPIDYYKFIEHSFSLVYIHKGAGNIILDKKSIPFKDNSFLLTNAERDWEFINNTNNYLDVYSFVLSNKLLRDFLKVQKNSTEKLLDSSYALPNQLDSYFIENCFNANFSKTGRLLQYFFSISNTAQYNMYNAKEIVFEILSTLYFEQNKTYKKINDIKGKKISTKIEIFKRLLTANDFINDTIYDTITIKDIAESCNMSEYHLYESFKKLFRLTPYQYITHLKMEKAKTYLNQESISVSEVAYKLGYTDLPTFSKAFKRKYNYNPSSFIYK